MGACRHHDRENRKPCTAAVRLPCRLSTGKSLTSRLQWLARPRTPDHSRSTRLGHADDDGVADGGKVLHDARELARRHAHPAWISLEVSRKMGQAWEDGNHGMAQCDRSRWDDSPNPKPRSTQVMGLNPPRAALTRARACGSCNAGGDCCYTSGGSARTLPGHVNAARGRACRHMHEQSPHGYLQQ